MTTTESTTSLSGRRPAEPGEMCECGRPAVEMIQTERLGAVGWCGRSDGGAAQASTMVDTPVLDFSAFTSDRRARALALVEEVEAITAASRRVLAEANEVLIGVAVDEHRVSVLAMAGGVTGNGAGNGDDELMETVSLMSGSGRLHGALMRLVELADPDSTMNMATRRAAVDAAPSESAVERVAEAMRAKRVRRLDYNRPTDLGGGYTATIDGGDLVVSHEGVPVARDSLTTLATVAAQLEACRSGEVQRLR